MDIFIIDKDVAVAEKLQFEIETSEKHRVHIFDNAARGVGQLSLNPDIIFIDHELGNFNGSDIIPLLLDKVPECKIVMFSKQTEIKIVEQALKKGAYRYIKKDNCLSESVLETISEIENLQTPSLLDRVGDALKLTTKRNRPLIFVVDDDELFNFALQHKLESMPKYNVETFMDGTTAIENAHRKPDILLLDYHLKKMKGSTILDKYRQISPKTKVIILSTQQEIDVALKLLEMGADNYLVKDEDVLENLQTTLKKLA